MSPVEQKKCAQILRVEKIQKTCKCKKWVVKSLPHRYFRKVFLCPVIDKKVFKMKKNVKYKNSQKNRLKNLFTKKEKQKKRYKNAFFVA